MLENEKTLNTRTAVICLRNDGILHVVARPVSDHTIEDAKENTAAHHQLIPDKPPPLLCDFLEVKQMDRDIRLYYAGEEHAQTYCAVAFLTKSFIGRFLGNLFISWTKPPRPTALFASEQKAIEWLKQFL